MKGRPKKDNVIAEKDGLLSRATLCLVFLNYRSHMLPLFLESVERREFDRRFHQCQRGARY